MIRTKQKRTSLCHNGNKSIKSSARSCIHHAMFDLFIIETTITHSYNLSIQKSNLISILLHYFVNMVSSYTNKDYYQTQVCKIIFHPWVGNIFILEHPQYQTISIIFRDHLENITARVGDFSVSICKYMSCHVMSHNTMPHHAMPCHARPHHTMSYHYYVISCHVTQHHATPCHAMPCHARPHYIMSYH